MEHENKPGSEFTAFDSVVAVLFTGLLVGSGFFLTDLKDIPQVVMLGFGIIILGVMLLTPRAKVNVAFYILFTGLLIIGYSLLIREIADMLNPDDGWVTVRSKLRRVGGTNHTWEWLSYVLAPLTIAWYDRRKRKNRKLEIALTAGFVIVALGVVLVG